MDNTINKRIAALRKSRGLNQEDVAERLGMKPSTYSQMERKGNISADKIVAIANILRVPAIELLYGQDLSNEQIATPSRLHDNSNPFARNEEIQDDSLELSPKEKQILTIYRHLPKAKKSEFISFIDNLRKR